MGLRLWWSGVVKKYTDFKDKIKTCIRNALIKILTALVWVETKVGSFKNWVVRGIDHISEFIRNLKLFFGMLIEAYRINKVVKLEKKVAKVKSKIGYQ